MDDDQVKYQEKVEVTEEVHQFDKREEHDSVDVEKAGHHQDVPHDLQEGTRRNLRTRHVTMIALGGCIGTGLFLNMGTNLATAGPAGAFIAYIVIGIMVYCIMTCLSEMAAFIPVSGSFNHYAYRFVEPALGFACGWNYWLSSVTVATELAAAATIIDFWQPVMPDPAWSTIFMVLFVSANCLSVRLYGESEYYFALIKVLMVLVFIIIAIIFTAGGIGTQGPIGFKYWTSPGAFAESGGVGVVSVLLSAGFSFQGTEIVGITAGEAANPVKAVPRAVNNTGTCLFWRILVFYILTILLIGMCIPSDNELMANSDGTPNSSPFTVIFELAGIQAGADVVNAIVLISVLSACNSSIYVTSRILLGLAHDGNAPRFFKNTNRFGAPYLAVLASSICGFAACFASIYSASVAFVWFLNITAISGFISWMFIGAVHIRFRYAYKKQGRDVDDLPYKSPWYPIPGIFSSVLCLLIILGQGYTAFTPQFVPVKFVGNYIGIVPFILCYIGHKIVRREPWVPIDEVDFETGRVTRHQIDEAREEIASQPWYKRYLFIFT